METETKLYDVPEVIALLEQIVEEFGRDHVAPKFDFLGHDGRVIATTCRYVTDDGQPSCIVGQVLAKVGHLMPENIEESWSLAGGPISRYYALFTSGATALLGDAQAMQDDRMSWGIVLDRIKEAYL